MATSTSPAPDPEEEYYYPAYFVQNGKPTMETAQQLIIYLDWCKQNEYTPYVTFNYGKPGGGGGCPPVGCQ